MKHMIFASTSLLSLAMAVTALAAGNDATIDQVGVYQNASIDQTASSSDAVATVTQSDGYNSAAVVQGGSGNQASVSQSQGAYGAVRNPSNVSNSDQEGTNDALTVIQVGNNTSSIQQLGGSANEHALVGQSNDGNIAAIVQAGNSELAVVNQQSGSNNNASIAQSGTGNGVYTAYPYQGSPKYGPNLVWDENVPGDSVLPGASTGLTQYGPVGAIVDQVGSNNVGGINQQGYQNFANVSQENDVFGTGGNTAYVSQGAGQYYSTGLVFQYGQSNSASVAQLGAATSYSTVWQYGNSNQAYSLQTGSDHSAIEQGFADDGNDLASAPVTGDYASVSQSGYNDSSEVRQTGDYDQAYVSQAGGNAIALITQGGAYNVAIIHQ